VPTPPRGVRRDQVSVTVDHETLVALRLLATRDMRSIPDLLRVLVDRHVKRAMKDPDFRQSVEHLLASRERVTESKRRRRPPATVADLAGRRSGKKGTQENRR
jgi:hypothetical protein